MDKSVGNHMHKKTIKNVQLNNQPAFSQQQFTHHPNNLYPQQSFVHPHNPQPQVINNIITNNHNDDTDVIIVIDQGSDGIKPTAFIQNLNIRQQQQSVGMNMNFESTTASNLPANPTISGNSSSNKNIQNESTTTKAIALLPTITSLQ